MEVGVRRSYVFVPYSIIDTTWVITKHRADVKDDPYNRNSPKYVQELCILRFMYVLLAL